MAFNAKEYIEVDEQGSGGATPASGKGKFYFKDDGNPYAQGDDGIEKELGLELWEQQSGETVQLIDADAIDMQSQSIYNVANPVDDQDAATKYYADNLIGGSTTQVQFNDGGVFGGDAGLIYDKTTDLLTAGILKTNSYIEVGEESSVAQPSSGNMRIYAKTDSKLYYQDDGGNEFLIQGGSMIKSIQRGIVEAPAIAHNATITISAVVLANSYCILEGVGGNGNLAGGAAGRLTGTTTITYTNMHQAGTYSAQVTWKVIEFK